eukprot:tig00000903_g5527.t1
MRSFRRLTAARAHTASSHVVVRDVLNIPCNHLCCTVCIERPTHCDTLTCPNCRAEFDRGSLRGVQLMRDIACAFLQLEMAVSGSAARGSEAVVGGPGPSHAIGDVEEEAPRRLRTRRCPADPPEGRQDAERPAAGLAQMELEPSCRAVAGAVAAGPRSSRTAGVREAVRSAGDGAAPLLADAEKENREEGSPNKRPAKKARDDPAAARAPLRPLGNASAPATSGAADTGAAPEHAGAPPTASAAPRPATTAPLAPPAPAAASPERPRPFHRLGDLGGAEREARAAEVAALVHLALPGLKKPYVEGVIADPFHRCLFDLGPAPSKEVVGAVVYKPMPRRRIAEITFLCVAEQARRRGIGPGLLAGLRREAREQGIRWLATFADATASKFFRRQGFTRSLQGHLQERWEGALKHYDWAFLMFADVDSEGGWRAARSLCTRTKSGGALPKEGQDPDPLCGEGLGPYAVLDPTNKKHVIGLYVHENCAEWAPDVAEDGTGGYTMFAEEFNRSRKIKCSYEACRQPGAAIGCVADRCGRRYHYPCVRRLSMAEQAKRPTMYEEEHVIDCAEHSGQAPAVLARRGRGSRKEKGKQKRRAGSVGEGSGSGSDRGARPGPKGRPAASGRLPAPAPRPPRPPPASQPPAASAPRGKRPAASFSSSSASSSALPFGLTGRRSDRIHDTPSDYEPARPFVILTSCLTDNDKKKLKELVEARGGARVADRWSPDVTHVVCNEENGRCRPTFRYLCGIARGAWVVSEGWVRSCQSHGTWMPEAQFQLKGDTRKSGGNSGAAHKSRAALEAGGPRLFEGLLFALWGRFTGHGPSRAQLAALPEPTRARAAYVIRSPETFEAGMGDLAVDLDAVVPLFALPPGARALLEAAEFVNPHWLYDSVAAYALLPDTGAPKYQAYSQRPASPDPASKSSSFPLRALLLFFHQ